MTSTSAMTSNAKYKSTPASFKLKLIAEVHKHNIIWKNLGERKNKDLCEDAWKRVSKALVVREVGYCEKQWNQLIRNYRNHINRKTAMRKDLAAAMVYMKPQIKKTPAGKKITNKKKNTTPKAQQVARKIDVAQTESVKPGVPGVRALSLAIVNYLFDCLPADDMTKVYDALTTVLRTVRPNLEVEILEHGCKQDNFFSPDWSGLPIPAELCQEIWELELPKRVRLSVQEEKKKE